MVEYVIDAARKMPADRQLAGSQSTLQRVVNIRGGGSVERCHTNPHHGSYSNASHQWGVAILMYVLWPHDYPRLSIYCLTHDVPEKWVGDVPATAKKYVPGIKEGMEPLEERLSMKLGLPPESWLSDDDMRKLKNCDYLELYLWCIEQQKMGVVSVREIILSLQDFFEEVPLLPEASALYKDIRADGHSVNVQRLRELIPLETIRDSSK